MSKVLNNGYLAVNFELSFCYNAVTEIRLFLQTRDKTKKSCSKATRLHVITIFFNKLNFTFHYG